MAQTSLDGIDADISGIEFTRASNYGHEPATYRFTIYRGNAKIGEVAIVEKPDRPEALHDAFIRLADVLSDAAARARVRAQHQAAILAGRGQAGG